MKRIGSGSRLSLKPSLASQDHLRQLSEQITERVDLLGESVEDYLRLQKCAFLPSINDVDAKVVALKNLLHMTVGNFLSETTSSTCDSELQKRTIDASPKEEEEGGGGGKWSGGRDGCSRRLFSDANEEEISRLHEQIRELLATQEGEQMKLSEDLQIFEEIKQDLADYINSFKRSFLRIALRSSSSSVSEALQSDAFNEFYDILTSTQNNWNSSERKLKRKNSLSTKHERFILKRRRDGGGSTLTKRSKSVDGRRRQKEVVKGQSDDIDRCSSRQAETIIENNERIARLEQEKDVEFTIFHTFLRQFTADNHATAFKEQMEEMMRDPPELDQMEQEEGESLAEEDIHYNDHQGVQGCVPPSTEVIFTHRQSRFAAHYDGGQEEEEEQFNLRRLQQQQVGGLYKLPFDGNRRVHRDGLQDRFPTIGDVQECRGSSNGFGQEYRETGVTNGMEFTMNGNDVSELLSFALQDPSFQEEEISNISCIKRAVDDQTISFLDTLDNKPTSRFMCQSSLKKGNKYRGLPKGINKYTKKFSEEIEETSQEEGHNYLSKGSHLHRGVAAAEAAARVVHMSFNNKEDLEKCKVESFMKENFDEVEESLELDEERIKLLECGGLEGSRAGGAGGVENKKKSKRLIELPRLDLSTIHCGEHLRNVRSIVDDKKNIATTAPQHYPLSKASPSSISNMSIPYLRMNESMMSHTHLDLLKGLGEDTIGVVQDYFSQALQTVLAEKNDAVRVACEAQEKYIRIVADLEAIAEENEQIKGDLEVEREYLEDERRRVSMEKASYLMKKEKTKAQKREANERQKQLEDAKKEIGQQQLMICLQEKNIIVSKQELEQQWSQVTQQREDVSRIEKMLADEMSRMEAEILRTSQLDEQLKLVKESLVKERQHINHERMKQLAHSQAMKQKEQELKLLERALHEHQQASQKAFDERFIPQEHFDPPKYQQEEIYSERNRREDSLQSNNFSLIQPVSFTQPRIAKSISIPKFLPMTKMSSSTATRDIGYSLNGKENTDQKYSRGQTHYSNAPLPRKRVSSLSLFS